jgi:hypothetical protein
MTADDFSPTPVSFDVPLSNQFSILSLQNSIECLQPTPSNLSTVLGMNVSTFPSNCALGWLNTNAVKTGNQFNSKEFGCVACLPGFKAKWKTGQEFFLIGK